MASFKAFIDIVGRSRVGKAVKKASKQMRRLRGNTKAVKMQLGRGATNANLMTSKINSVATSNLSRNFLNASRNVSLLTRRMKSLPTNMAKKTGRGMLNVSSATKKSSISMGKFNNVVHGGIRRLAHFGEVSGEAKEKAIGFRGGMLSMMFAGMALSRVFSRMFGPIMKLVGVGEIMSSMFKSLMAPAMLAVLPNLLSMVDAVMKISPEIKKLIGYVTLFMGVLGTLGSTVGITVLAFGGLASTSVAAIAAIVGLAGAITALLVRGKDMSKFFGDLPPEIEMIFSGIFTAIRKYTKGIINVFKGFLNLAKGLFTANFEQISKGLRQIFEGIITFLKGFFIYNVKTIVGAGGILGRVIINAFNYVKSKIAGLISGIVNQVTGWFVTLKEKFIDFVSDVKNIIPDWLMSLISGGVSVATFGLSDAVGSALNDFIMQDGKIHRINQRDTIVGSKNGVPGGNKVDISVNVDNVSNEVDIRRIADEIESRFDNKFTGRNF